MLKKLLLLAWIFLLFEEKVFAQDAGSEIESLKQRFADAKTEVERARILSDLCWSYITVSVDSSLMYGRQAIDQSLKAKDQKVLAQALNDCGIALMLKGDYKEAMRMFSESKETRQRLGDQEGVASLDLKMGNLYYKIGKPDSAMHFYTGALGFYEKAGRELETSVLLGNIGSTYLSIKAYDKALSYCLQSLELQKKINRNHEAAGMQVNIGNIYYQQRDTTQAVKAYREAERIALAAKNNSALAAALNNLSNIYLARGDFSEAKKLVMRSIGLRESLGEISELSSGRLTLAIVLNAEGKHAEALHLLRDAKRVFEGNDSMDRLASVYLQMARSFGGLHQTDSLNHYLGKYEVLIARLTEKEMLKNSADLEARYESDKKDTELEKSRLKIRERNFLLGGSAAVILLLGVIAILVVREQRRKNRAQLKEHQYMQALAHAENENRLKEQRIGISRELHDNIGSYLTFIDTSVKNIDSERGGAKISELRELTAETIAELRKTVWLINKPEVNIQEWAVKLADLYRRIPQVEVSGDDLPEEVMLNTQQATALLRVVQEAVNNALKHSGSDGVEVRVTSQKAVLEVKVTDTGKGFESTENIPGYGWLNMRQRMEELNGSVQVISQKGEGTQVAIALPLER